MLHFQCEINSLSYRYRILPKIEWLWFGLKFKNILLDFGNVFDESTFTFEKCSALFSMVLGGWKGKS